MGQEPKKVGRRTFLNYAIAIIATGVIVGAATYFATPKSVVTITAPGTTITTTKTVTETPLTSPTTTPTITPTTVRIMVCSSGPTLDPNVNRGQAVQQLANEYMKKNPSVNIDVLGVEWEGYYEKIVTMFEAGDPCDIINMSPWWIDYFYERGYLYELDDFIKTIPLNKFYKVSIDSGIVKGHQVYLAFAPAVHFTFINKKIFKESGVAYPLETWDEVIAAGPKIVRENRYLYYFGYSAPIYPYAYQEFENITYLLADSLHPEDFWYNPEENKYVFNGKAGYDALSMLKMFFDKKWQPDPFTTPESDMLLANDMLAIGAHISRGYAVYKNKYPEFYKTWLGAMHWPTKRKGGPRWSQISGWGWSVANPSVYKKRKAPSTETVLDVLRYLLEPESQAITTWHLPGRPDAIPIIKEKFGAFADEPDFDVAMDALNYNVIPRVPTAGGKRDEIITDMLSKVYYENMDIQKALDWAVEEINKLI